MEKIRINVRKEVIKCKKCGNPKSFYYLSDFAYGQRLIFINNATEYAYTNLIEDKCYLEYINIVKKILFEKSIEVTDEILSNLIDQTYGITCDLVKGYKVNFSETQNKCVICNSKDFERNMIEPESFVQMDVYTISHKFWESLSQDKKEKLVEKEFLLREIG